MTRLRITVTSSGFEKDGVDHLSDGWGSLSQICKCFSSFNFVLVNFVFLLFYEYLKRVLISLYYPRKQCNHINIDLVKKEDGIGFMKGSRN